MNIKLLNLIHNYQTHMLKIRQIFLICIISIIQKCLKFRKFLGNFKTIKYFYKIKNIMNFDNFIKSLEFIACYDEDLLKIEKNK